MIHGLEYYTKYSKWPEGAITKFEEIVIGETYYRVWCWEAGPPRPIVITEVYAGGIFGKDSDGMTLTLSSSRYNIPEHYKENRFLFRNYWFARALVCRLIAEEREKECRDLGTLR